MSFVFDTDCCRTSDPTALCGRCRSHFGLSPAAVGNGTAPSLSQMARWLEGQQSHATPPDPSPGGFDGASASPLRLDPASGRLTRNLTTPIPPPPGGDMITRMRQLDMMLRRDADEQVLAAVADSDAGLLAEALSRLEAVGDGDGPAATRIRVRLEQLRSATVAANGMEAPGEYVAPSTLAVINRGPISPLESGEMTPSVVDWSDASGLTEGGYRRAMR